MLSASFLLLLLLSSSQKSFIILLPTAGLFSQILETAAQSDVYLYDIGYTLHSIRLYVIFFQILAQIDHNPSERSVFEFIFLNLRILADSISFL